MTMIKTHTHRNNCNGQFKYTPIGVFGSNSMSFVSIVTSDVPLTEVFVVTEHEPVTYTVV